MKDIKPFLDDLLKDLSYEIFLKKHRLRYQEEQKERYLNAVCKFNSTWYLLKNRTAEEFIEDYNSFLL